MDDSDDIKEISKQFGGNIVKYDQATYDEVSKRFSGKLKEGRKRMIDGIIYELVELPKCDEFDHHDSKFDDDLRNEFLVYGVVSGLCRTRNVLHLERITPVTLPDER